MKDKQYNGWTNWETWNFKLWIDNDICSHRATQELTLRCMSKSLNKEKVTYQLSLELREWADDMLESVDLEAGFLTDICNNAIKEINFVEIAEAYIVDMLQSMEVS